jgi:uncharacterized damage-inducible protein DinB
MDLKGHSLETEQHLQRIAILREKVSDLVAAAPDEALNWLPGEGEVPYGFNSLAVLATHIAGTEHYWISEVIGKRPSVRDREAEFAAKASNNQPLLQMLELTGKETLEILSGLSDEDLDTLVEVDSEKISIRWCLMQVASHTALHLGHMQVTFQLWNQGKMFTDLRWKNMLPHEAEI